MLTLRVSSFDGTWDWTAIGTLALAAATFLSPLFARSALKKTQSQIELGQAQLAQTQSEIELSRREVEEAHRPVVVPLADRRPMEIPQEQNRPAKPWASSGTLYVPIENVGSGPALDIEAKVELRNAAGQWTGTAGGEQLGAAAALGASSRIIVSVTIPSLEGTPGFQLMLTYSDIAGKEWVTEACYVPNKARFVDLLINPLV